MGVAGGRLTLVLMDDSFLAVMLAAVWKENKSQLVIEVDKFPQVVYVYIYICIYIFHSFESGGLWRGNGGHLRIDILGKEWWVVSFRNDDNDWEKRTVPHRPPEGDDRAEVDSADGFFPTHEFRQ